MRLTTFPRLKNAVQGLDHRYFERLMEELEERLAGEGKSWVEENTALTEEGIFYLDPDSGMATKVVLFEPEHTVQDGSILEELFDGPISDEQLIERLNVYHLVRCNELTRAEQRRKFKRFLLLHRLDGTFPVKVLRANADDPQSSELVAQHPDQRLFMCRNCHLKVTSLLEGVRNTARERFELKRFFNIDFFRSWIRFESYAPEDPSLTHMYPKDWANICTLRKHQVQYQCESCGNDFHHRQRELRILPVERHRKKMSYVRLRCLCRACFEECTGRVASSAIAAPKSRG